MTIRFTEGFGIYGTGDIAAKLLNKWSRRGGVGAINAIDGRHPGTGDNGIVFAVATDYLEQDIAVAAGATVVLGVAYKRVVANGASNTVFGFYDVAGANLIEVRVTNSDGTLSIYKNGVFFANTTVVADLGVWVYFEFVYNSAGGGSFSIRRNGSEGYTAAHGIVASTVGRIRLGTPGTSDQYQDIYVADNAGPAPQNAPLGDVRIETLLPNAVGASSGWAVVHQNRLTANQASLETDTVGWAALANTSIARTTAYASHGSASLSITCTAGNLASAITTEGTGGVPVLASTTYSARFDVKNTVGFNRTVIAEIRWYDSGGAVISTTTGTGVVIPPSGTGLVTVSGASPSNAAFAAVIAKLDPIASGEVLYIDAIQFSQMASIPTFKLPERHNALNDASHDGDASYVSSDTAGQKDTYVHSDLSTVSGTVFGVRPALTFNRQAVGARTVGAVARVGTTDHDSAATVTPDDTIGVYKTKSVDFPTNPSTGSAWTIAEVNAAEFGPKIAT